MVNAWSVWDRSRGMTASFPGSARQWFSVRGGSHGGWVGLIRRLAVFAILVGVLDLFGSDYARSVAVTVVITAIAAVSLTVLMGWVGQPSVMVSGLVLAGGYCAALLANVARLPFLVVIVCSLLVGLLLGWLLSIPARRLGGLYQLLATLAYFYIITNLGNQIQSQQGALGGYTLPTASVFGWAVGSPTAWLTVGTVTLFLTAEYFIYLRSTRIGRAWILIRENRDAAEVAGIQVRRSISLAFALTTAFQFVSGVLLAYELGTVSYDTVTLIVSVSFIVMIVLGGMGSIVGAVVGAGVVVAIPPMIQDAFGNGSGTGGGYVVTHLTAIEGLVYALIAGIVVLRIDRRLVTRGKRAAKRLWSGRRSSSAESVDRRIDTPAAPPTRHGAIPARSVDVSHQGSSATGPSLPGTDDLDWIVRVEQVSVRYAGGEEVLHQVDLTTVRNGATALVGRNGAGKTTLLSSIAGFVPSAHAEQATGHVWFRTPEGAVLLDGLSPMERSRLGIAFVPAEEKVFGGLTVEEQIREALSARRSKGHSSAINEVFEVFPDLYKLRGIRAGLLSGGERQQLAMAVAVGTRARLLIIDEASLGLSPALVSAVTDLLVRLRDDGRCSLLLAEQNPTMAFAVANHVVLVEDGNVAAEGVPSDELMAALERSYLGSTVPPLRSR
jgi:branched-chain amino acid transport system permease protein